MQADALATALHAMPGVLTAVAATQAQLHYTLHSLTDFVRAQSSAIVSLEIEQRAAAAARSAMQQQVDASAALIRELQRDAANNVSHAEVENVARRIAVNVTEAARAAVQDESVAVQQHESSSTAAEVMRLQRLLDQKADAAELSSLARQVCLKPDESTIRLALDQKVRALEQRSCPPARPPS